jgi:hypothetical protein
MNEPTLDPEAIANTEAQPKVQNSEKEAWVTPVVREYDPAEVTHAFFSGAGVDTAIYS